MMIKIGDMRILAIASVMAIAPFTYSCSHEQSAEKEVALKDAFEGKFLIGAALNARQVCGDDTLGAAVAAKHFNTIVAENVMKSEKINPLKGVYNWTPADSFVEWGEKNGMYIVGHCLVWHSQLAPWFPVDDEGNLVCADTLRQRMATAIGDIVGRYKGRVKGWDVVNEAILEDGSYRETPFYKILGEEFIPYAFQLAHEADPDAELYINDYSMDSPAKADKYVEIVNDLKARGLRIDAIGMQAHMGLDYPDFDEFETSMVKFGNTGCKVMLTELDMSALPTLTRSANVTDTVDLKSKLMPYADGLPADVDSLWNSRMKAVFQLALKHEDIISRVNAWGVSDGDSWKNDWPIRGRKEYPLLFDRNHEMKPFLKELIVSQGETECSN